ncbi:P-loop containing nucleoside triphosphate hydrolase protein [Rhexocercosporidium sp. MPI-PUGE-AT-0058]|nr:P-loop containing nucleoside triphosphate hydrolase protein [Rhexocercosporidium sp. MPI-PUGE-AT-0058]
MVTTTSEFAVAYDGLTMAKPEFQGLESNVLSDKKTPACQTTPILSGNATSSDVLCESDEGLLIEAMGDDENVSNLRYWSYQHLKRLVVKAKGGASKQVVKFVKTYLGGTKLIFVVGQSGTGKTTMLRELSGLDLKVGGTLNSGTLQYQVCPALIEGEQYLFVDTAGFGAADLDDSANFENILSCLTALSPFVTIAGLIFVYGSMENRFKEADVKTIQWVQCFCGPEFYRNIVIVTNMWDQYKEKQFRKQWEKLSDFTRNENVKQILNPPERYHGGHIYHHGLPGGDGTVDSGTSVLDYEDDSSKRGDELRKLIQRTYSAADSKPVTLQVLEEMKDGTPQQETQAAKALKAMPVHTKINIRNHRAVVCTTDTSQHTTTPGIPTSEAPTPPAPSRQVPIHQAPTPETIAPKPKVPKAAEKSRQQASPQSWFERLLAWFEIGKQASVFFKEARESAHTKTKPPTWSIWGSLRDWWAGAPPA